MNNYIIRNASSVEEVKTAVTQSAVDREGWSIGMDDHELLFAVDPTGIFIGELDGLIISSLCVVKFGDNHAFLGHNIVDKLYRGKGYGLTIFKAGMASLSKNHNCALDAQPWAVYLYEKSGFQRAWTNSKLKFMISDTSRILEGFNPPPKILMRPANQVNFNDLSAYTSEVFGAPLSVYLGKMLEAPNIISFAATSEGIIVGFVSARREVTKGAWQIRPLYADNTLIARCMLKHVFSILVSKAVPDEYAIMCVPCDVNPEAHELGKELKGSLHACSVQMYSRGTPNIPKQKMYGVMPID